MSENPTRSPGFSGFGLDAGLLEMLAELGFEEPTPIQTQTIALLMRGRDLMGQAQTGTGKTAAFGLPLMGRMDPGDRATQALILAPTRELALQVARALEQFAAAVPGLRVLAVYGGQDYVSQLKALRRGAHIVVGTPGRVMDHMRRGSLKLDGLKTLVLDEADEMLNMGFVDDIEWILGQCPAERQTALFSATIPSRIRELAKTYMREPEVIRVDLHTTAAVTIRQRHWVIRGLNKRDALCRILEAEELDAALIFVRTKAATVELAEQLVERRFRAGALHGDMPQGMREHTVSRLKKGQIDLLVATDVAARGLDIERFSHVINFDMPGDAESYVHRIGRTGRAGKEGQAISLVAPREGHLLRVIERVTRQPIEAMQLPGAAELNARRIKAFKEEIRSSLVAGELEPFVGILSELCEQESLDPLEVAAALAKKAQGSVPLLFKEVPSAPGQPGRKRPARSQMEEGMVRYRVELGHEHGLNPNHLVGAIANSTGLRSRHIGRITIHEDHSLVDLPEGMPPKIFNLLKKVRIFQNPLNLSLDRAASREPKAGFRPSGGKEKGKKRKPKRR